MNELEEQEMIQDKDKLHAREIKLDNQQEIKGNYSLATSNFIINRKKKKKKTLLIPHTI